MDVATSAAWKAPFEPGDPAPWFSAPSPDNKTFHFSVTTGRYVLLGFLPSPGSARSAAFDAFSAHRALFNDTHIAAFMVLRDAASIAQARNQPPGLRWFLDADGAVSRLYGALDDQGGEHPYWLLLDPTHRALAVVPFDDVAQLYARIEALPAVDDYAGAELHAPVLILPRVLEPELCQQLIGLYDAQGGLPSGVMRDVDGRTVGVLDDFKRRHDVLLSDEGIQKELMARIRSRLTPAIEQVFQFKVTRLERYLVACYDAADGGYFRPHRDNETLGTAHRRFAVSINLNAADFEGGDLRFPEFGSRTYRPPTGGAVIFSCSLQHEATPVTRGRRYAFLPFLYDEAGQAIRERNVGALEGAWDAANSPEEATPS
jgi:predicted 2-oxoglutarate/Fe(II)-dependent dioxygenase YbiX/peroxiredoxin